MNQDKFTTMLSDGKDFIQIVQSIPEDKRFLLSMMADAFVNGMLAQEQLAAEQPNAWSWPRGRDGWAKQQRKGGITMNDILYPRGVDSARIIQVIETRAARGSGSSEQPSRMVTQYWSLEGELLSETDPYLREMLSACSNANSDST